ncbi:S8 family serine peptidase, partial [uncultured Polaribacter sp.]|uniref:S8 family serine peptidase n=1 Tax=uncultured Polaribacter sp. TaxID=174711 RepID=UPI00262F54E8
MKFKLLLKTVVLVLLFSLGNNLLTAQTKQQKQKIINKYDAKKSKKLQESILKKERDAKSRVDAFVNSRKGKNIKNPNEIVDIINGRPMYYGGYNLNAAKSTRTDHLHANGSLGLNLEGQGMTFYVWDGGSARITHNEYDGPGGNNRYTYVDDTYLQNGNPSNHAAHVSGTIMAYGANPEAKGMAPKSKVVGYDWSDDTSEIANEAANGMLISNHSYGPLFRDLETNVTYTNGDYLGMYIGVSKIIDEISYTYPNYLFVCAAGNSGTDDTVNTLPLGGNSTYDKLATHAVAKNSLTVANTEDANVDANGNLISVTINSSSSEGPTDDYRIKPDIAGNGTLLTSSGIDSDSAYLTYSGTSMASPNVSGSLLLVQQHNNNKNGQFLKAATLKGLALHTADDIAPTGPDAITGWGLLNAKKIIETINDDEVFSIINEETLTQGETYTLTVQAKEGEPLIASISWTDPAGVETVVNDNNVNSTTPILVNDLDIKITKGNTNYLPYRLTSLTSNDRGDNIRDPYEKTDVSNPSGTYTITVTHKGQLSSGSQNFSLIVSGITINTNSSCTDGIQNGSETGVDCGGDCAPCNTSTDPCAGVAAYNSSTTYNSGDKVVYQDELFQLNSSGAWDNLG